MLFGIYIAKFKNSLYNAKEFGKDILGSYVIGLPKDFLTKKEND